jgi:hypothetical protein
MALIPFAEKQLIKPGVNDPRIEARIGILHVDGGNAYNLHDFFEGRSGGIESHTHIPKDGHLFQYRDTDWQADANYKANDFAISVETQGYAAGEWTPQQIAMIKRLMLWCVTAHGIPLRKVTSWNDPRGGWGFHIQFPQWHPVAKSCPGPDRIRQFNNVLVPWMEEATEGGDNMAGVPNFEERMIESNTRIEALLQAEMVANGHGTQMKAALAAAEKTNDARDEREGRD